MQCLTQYYYYCYTPTGPHIRNILLLLHIETLSLRKPAKLCMSANTEWKVVRKLAITPLTIKDSHDKNETCKNERIFYSICAFKHSNLVFNCISSIVLLSTLKLHLTFIDLDETKLYSQWLKICCTVTSWRIRFMHKYIFIPAEVVKYFIVHCTCVEAQNVLNSLFTLK